jgi:hypothetical protein
LDDRPRVCRFAEAERKGCDRKADQDSPLTRDLTVNGGAAALRVKNCGGGE